MSPSKLRGLGLPTLIVCLTAAGAGALFQQGRPAALQGQTEKFDEWDFVPPSPAPSRDFLPVASAPTVLSPRASAPTLPRLNRVAPARASTSAAPPALHRHVSATINSAVASAPRKTAVGAASSQRVTPLGSVSTAGGVVTTSSQLELVPSEQPVPESNRFAIIKKPAKAALPPMPAFPSDRASPPSVLGSHLGLHPGETATERSLRLMSAIGELERHVENTTYENATLNAAVKERDDKLQMAIREIRAARKDLVTSREELDRLKREVESLREKVRSAEKDNAAVLQTMAPLLQQLLESDDVGTLPTERAE